MKKQTRKSVWIAATASVIAASLSPSLTAQMPGTKFSPWNQLGRAWGIGIGDGYHECVNCPQKEMKGYGINAFRTSGDAYGNPKFTAQNFSHCGSGCGVPGCTACSQTHPTHTVLPPSGHGYHQGMPQANPWATSPQVHYQSTTTPPSVESMYRPPNEMPRSQMPNPIPADSAPPMSRKVAPTPATREPIRNPLQEDAELIEPKRMPERARQRNSDELESSVPSASPNDDDLLGNDYLLDSAEPTPPPTLRKRQPSDKPLGELPSERSERTRPREDLNSEDRDSLIPMDDESFELVPSKDLPPVTQRRLVPTRQSTKAIPVSVGNAWNDRMHQQSAFYEPRYVDDGYSYRRPVRTTGSDYQFDTQFESATRNRYK